MSFRLRPQSQAFDIFKNIDVEGDGYLISYLLQEQKSHAAFLICPGGGYGHLSYYEGHPVACWLNNIGVSAFVLNYSVAPNRYPTAFNEAKRAIRFIRSRAGEWNIDTNKIGIIGFSAGGHLAAQVSNCFNVRDSRECAMNDEIEKESAKPNLSILGYPVLSTRDDLVHEGSMKNLLGESPSKEELRFQSIETHVGEHTPPTFLWSSSRDTLVSPRNSLTYAEQLAKHNVSYDFHLFGTGGHGVATATVADRFDEECAMWRPLCQKWIQRHFELK